MATERDTPYIGRLMTCDLCGRVGTRADVAPTLVRVAEPGRPDRYVDVLRCRDRRMCVPDSRPAPVLVG